MRWGTLSLFLALAIFASAAEAAPSLYVANTTNRTVSAFTIGPNGAPSSAAGSPYSVGITPVGVSVTPDAEHLYVTNLESHTISGFEIGPDGALTPIAGSPFATNAGPWGVAVSPDGGHLYVVNSWVDLVSAYAIAADGSLSPVPGSPFATGTSPDSTANGVAITPDGGHLYVTNMNGGGNISAFSISALDGSLSLLPGSPFDSGATARPVSVTPDGKHLYVGTSENKIWGYSIAADGALSQVGGSPFFTEGQSLGLAVSPDGAHLYGTHVGGGANVWGYSIGATGALDPLAGAPFPTGSWRGHSATVSPDGKRLYATNSGFHHISVYSVASSGSLNAIAGSPFPAGYSSSQVVITPDQGPVAEFSAEPTPAGNPLSLNASASSDSDGSVAKYHWDFGDGETAVTSTATTTHVYENAGDYTVTLTVTDNSGCSTTQIFSGQTVGCNGSPLAQIAHQVTVPPGELLGVSAAGSGTGSVTSSPAGIDCPGACAYSFEPGTQVTLNPEPAPGSAFTGWSGGGCSGTEPCEVVVEADAGITASFTKLPPPPPPEGCESNGGCPSPPSADPPPAGPTQVPAQLRIKRVQGRDGVVVGGTIASAARGAVRVKVSAYVDGRRISVSRRARITRGRWQARLGSVPGVGGANATLYLIARFQGSPGVEGGRAERRIRGLPST